MSETVRLLPPGIDLGATDEPVKASAWKNMFFTTDGKSGTGDRSWPSKEEAKQHADDWIFLMQVVGSFRDLSGNLRPAADFSHVIQISWNKP